MDVPNTSGVALLIILLSSSIYGLGVSEPLVDGDSSNEIPSSSSRSAGSTSASTGGQGPPLWNRIEGKLIAPMEKKTNEWLVSTQIMVNGGEHIGLLKEDGSFVVEGLPAGSHVIEVIHPHFQYETARVDITSKGKLRARKVNYIQPALVTHMPYPLRLNPTGPYKYFIPREQWRIQDVLFSPMVLMMVLPLVLILILPKMMSDPETRKEMEAMQMPKYEMPEMSEMLTSFFGGGSSNSEEKDKKKAIKGKKNN